MSDSIRIDGARSDALLGYLKALGLLRIVAEQADELARGQWDHGVFVLHTSLTGEELEEFLLQRWEPAPAVSPWNGGSGFFPMDNKEAFAAIEVDTGPRLAPFRSAIDVARAVLDEQELIEKPDPKTQKPDLLRALRAHLPDEAISWLDTAAVLTGEIAAFPPLLGSGGNDGRFDIANNYAQAVVAVLGDGMKGATSADWLEGSLSGVSVRLEKISLAHLMRDASPVNSPAGESDALGNPWDLVLAVTGMLMLGSGAARRLADGARASLVAPFTFAASGAGYGSAVAKEKGKAEVWMPLWERPASLREVEAMFREARARVGDRSAQSGLDAARAAGELGVARGISAFERYSILERAGLSNLSVHAGRIAVTPRAGARALRTLDPWLSRVLGYAAGDVPAAHRGVIRRLEQAVFALAEQDSPQRTGDVLAALGATEALLSRATSDDRPIALQPLTPKAAPWLELLGTDRIEHRLAVAIASLADRVFAAGTPALRHYLHGTGRAREVDRISYGVAVRGRPPSDAGTVVRLAAVAERRHRDAADSARPLSFDYGVPIALTDMATFVTAPQNIDDRLLGNLIDGLVIMDFRGATYARPGPGGSVDPVVATMALATYDPGTQPGVRARVERLDEPCVPRADWATMLRAGQVDRVLAEALLRLRLAGLPQIAAADDLQADPAQADPASGPRLAAALLMHPALSDLEAARDLLTDYPPSTPAQEIPA